MRTTEVGAPPMSSGAPAAHSRGPSADPEGRGFGERLAYRVRARQSQLVLGLDPDPLRLWPRALELAGGAGTPPAPPDAQVARAVSAHCRLVIEAVAEQCVATKLQSACFERLGAPGWAAMREVTEHARDHGLLVIHDGKRGDIDVTAAAYAQALLGHTDTPYGRVEGLGADAVTVNPLLGLDSLVPFVTEARERDAGLFVLVRTSNPGAADVQERQLLSGAMVSQRLAEMVAELGRPSLGEAGLADIGAVVGATAPDRLAALRESMPHTPFLLPGVGAQGGKVEDLAAAFAPGPAGGLVSSSRGLVGAGEKTGGDLAEAARREAGRLRTLAWGLG
jgi:orotidine-5'-phosphate decarboxylase